MAIKPIIKWAGGKRKFAKRICSCIKYKDDCTYFEPFLGGAAVLLNLLPKNAICFDKNSELINLYNVVKKNPKELIDRLYNYYVANHSKEFYYEVRGMDRNIDDFGKLSRIDKAARFLYLNKSCYNGLWRVNSNDQNNVPFGKYKKYAFTSSDDIMELSSYLNNNNVTIQCKDYSAVLRAAKKGDIVYFDPPYDIEKGENSFSTYTKDGFSRDDQKKLRDICVKLLEKGVRVLVSNSNTKYINELYNLKCFIINRDLTCVRTVGSSSNSRKSINEVLIIGVPYEE